MFRYDAKPKFGDTYLTDLKITAARKLYGESIYSILRDAWETYCMGCEL